MSNFMIENSELNSPKNLERSKNAEKHQKLCKTQDIH